MRCLPCVHEAGSGGRDYCSLLLPAPSPQPQVWDAFVITRLARQIFQPLWPVVQVILKGEEKRSCQVEDVTTTVRASCGSLSSGSKVCKLDEKILPSTVELCPSCDAFALVLYYSCRMSKHSARNRFRGCNKEPGQWVLVLPPEAPYRTARRDESSMFNVS